MAATAAADAADRAVTAGRIAGRAPRDSKAAAGTAAINRVAKVSMAADIAAGVDAAAADVIAAKAAAIVVRGPKDSRAEAPYNQTVN